MKTLFPLLLCLFLAGTAHAASQKITDLPASPAPTPDSLLELSYKTNGGSYASKQVAVSNLVPVLATNRAFVASGLNTNVIVATNAGTAAVNLSYKFAGAGRFTNGIYSITYSLVDDMFYLSNATQRLYSLEAFGDMTIVNGQTWTSVAPGVDPGAATWWGPITNNFTTVVGYYPLELPVLNTNLYVDALIGNDTNAVVGRMDRPWRNVYVACAAARSGQSIKVGPGVFTGGIFVSNGVSLEGSGIGVTFISGAISYVYANTRVANATFLTTALHVGQSGFGRATNVVIENCWIDSNFDGIYLEWWGQPVTIQNCPFIGSDYDGIADWDDSAATTPRVVKIRNCGIYAIDTATHNALHGLSGSGSRYEFYGCSIVVSNGLGDNYGIWLAGTTSRSTTSGSVLLSETIIQSGSTNQVSRTIVTSNGQPVTVIGAAVPTTQLGTGVVVNTNVPTVFNGTNSPEAVLYGAVGSLFLRSDGPNVSSLYTKTNGVGNTGWSAIWQSGAPLTNSSTLTNAGRADFGGAVTISGAQTNFSTLTNVGRVDIGGSVYVAGGFTNGGNMSVGSTLNLATPDNGISFNGRGWIRSSANGETLLINNAGTSYQKLQLGGTTAAYPALGRTNGDLIVFGGDGAFAGGSTNRLIVQGGILAQSGISTPGTAIAYTSNQFLDFGLGQTLVMTNSITNGVNVLVTNFVNGVTASIHINGATSATNLPLFLTFPANTLAVWYTPTNTTLRSNKWTMVSIDARWVTSTTNIVFVVSKEQP